MCLFDRDNPARMRDYALAKVNMAEADMARAQAAFEQGDLREASMQLWFSKTALALAEAELTLADSLDPWDLV